MSGEGPPRYPTSALAGWSAAKGRIGEQLRKLRFSGHGMFRVSHLDVVPNSDRRDHIRVTRAHGGGGDEKARAEAAWVLSGSAA